MFRFAVILALVLSVGYCQFYPLVYATEQVRFRIDVAIETPSGLKTGSGVWGYRLKPFFHGGYVGFDGEWRWTRWIDAQAIGVPLDDGRVIYALLGGRMMPGRFGPDASFTNGFMNGFPVTQLWRADRQYADYDESGWIRAKSEIAIVAGRKGKTFQLECLPEHHSNPESDCPAFALVKQPGGPPDAKLLDINDLGGSLGPGYRLRHVRLTVSEAPVTRNLAALPRWVRVESRERVMTGGWSDNREEMLETGFVRSD